MTLLFPSSPVPDNGVQHLAANHIVLRGYRIGMIAARASPDAPASLAAPVPRTRAADADLVAVSTPLRCRSLRG